MRVLLPVMLWGLFLGMPPSLTAQWRAPSVLWQPPLSVSSDYQKLIRVAGMNLTSRREGAAIGASIGAMVFAVSGAIACGRSNSHHCTRVTLGAGLIGSLVGGLIGSSFESGRPGS
jgi:hypothetical protein